MRATIFTFSGKKLEPAIYPDDARTMSGGVTPADSDTVQYARGTLMGRVTDTGLWAAYNPTGSDGSEHPVGFLIWDISVDVSGNVALTTTPGATGELGQTQSDVPVYIGGYLFGQDLLQSGDTGVIDDAAIAALNARWIYGDLTNGILKF